MSEFPSNLFSPEKQNFEFSFDSSQPMHDPLAITPKPTPTETEESINLKKRDLELTPPEIENKFRKSLAVDQPAGKALNFQSVPPTEPNEISTMGETNDAVLSKMTEMFATLSDKLDRNTDTLKEIRNDIQEGLEDRARISGMVAELRNEVAFLKAQPVPANILGMKDDIKNDLKVDLKAELKAELKEELKPEMKAEFKEELSRLYERQFINNLLDDIYNHEFGMVVFGYTWPNGISVEHFRNVCRDQLKYGGYAASLGIRSVSTLSRGKGPNPRLSVLVVFNSIAERNECLRQSFNLAGTAISFDPYMPKSFEAKYREFKDSAWKLRTTMEVKTFIGFENHELVLKQRQKNTDNGNFGWIIFDKWTPKASDPPLEQTRPGPKPDTSVSATIDINAMKKMVFVSGINSEIEKTELENKIKSDLIGQEDHLLIEKAKVAKKGTVVLYFHDSKDIAAFIQKYAGKEFLGVKIRLSQG